MMKRVRGTSSSHHLLSLVLIISCLTGAILAQTFQYSRGWTNGKKRSGATVVPYVFQESSEGQEVLGLCQMIRLREVLQGRHREQPYLPCEILGKTEDDILERFRRKADLDENTLLDSIPSGREPN